MDSLKPIIEAVKKYHLWCVCLLVLLLALYCWSSGTQKLTAEFKANQARTQVFFGNVKGVIPINKEVVKEKDDATRQTQDEGCKVWELFYNAKVDFCLWPAGVDDNFMAAIEKAVQDGAKGTLAGTQRDVYDQALFSELQWLKWYAGVPDNPGGSHLTWNDANWNKITTEFLQGKTPPATPAKAKSPPNISGQERQANRSKKAAPSGRVSAIPTFRSQERFWGYYAMAWLVRSTNEWKAAEQGETAAGVAAKDARKKPTISRIEAFTVDNKIHKPVFRNLEVQKPESPAAKNVDTKAADSQKAGKGAPKATGRAASAPQPQGAAAARAAEAAKNKAQSRAPVDKRWTQLAAADPKAF